MRRAAPVLLSLVIGLFLTELLARIFLPYNTPDTLRAYSMRYRPAVYARHLLEPAEGLVEIDEGKAWGTKPADAPPAVLFGINGLGYRGPARSPRKPPGTIRVIVLGGSAVFDQNVSDVQPGRTEDWPHQIERLLRARGLQGIEVWNAGVPGHSSADSLGRLYTQLWLYEPDFVVVYHAWNDLKFWHREPVSPDRPLIGEVPVYDPSKDLFRSYASFLDRWLSFSQVYVKLRNRWVSGAFSVGAEGFVGSGEIADDYGPFGPAQFRLNLELIVEASRRIGAEPVLTTQASLLWPDASPEARERITYSYQRLSHDALVSAYQETFRIVEEIGRERDVPVIDVARALAGREGLLDDHVHTTPEGSRAVAEVVAEGLLPLLEARIAEPGAVTDP